jgi:hypothetical protein
LTGTKTLSGLVEPFFNSVERQVIAAFDGIPKATKNFADAALALIKARTVRGQFTNGNSAPYSEDYARRVKGGRRSPVTLVQTGQMFKAMQVQEGGTGAGFAPSGKGSKFRNSLGQWAAASHSWEENIEVLDTKRTEPLRKRGSRTNRQIANYHNLGAGRNQKREFLGLTDQESQELFGKVFESTVVETGTPGQQGATLTVKMRYGG